VAATPVTPAFGRLGQEDLEFQASLGCTVRPCFKNQTRNKHSKEMTGRRGLCKAGAPAGHREGRLSATKLGREAGRPRSHQGHSRHGPKAQGTGRTRPRQCREPRRRDTGAWRAGAHRFP
jgi:hypothetical protein